jgi:hypothetical protein
MSLENIIRSLENGICPPELNYKNNEDEGIDWDKVLYNLKYKQPEFYEQKFPPECKQIPAFDQIIDLIVEKNYNNSPLKEILERQDQLIELQENLNNNYEEHDPSTSNTDTA